MSKKQIIRASSWIGFANYLRGTNRNSFSPDGWFDGLSFRVVQDSEFYIVRGGCCRSVPRCLRTTHRDSNHTNNIGGFVGFRVVCDA